MTGRVIRIAAVSFFNTTPLVYGLADDPDVSLRFAVPSALLDELLTQRADVALLPVIDYQRAPNLRLLPATGIGCDGPTLTVRLFSRSPIEHTRVLAADTDSHTSVALARIILRKRYGLQPEVIPLDRASDDPDTTRLVIGDKVITHEPRGFPHQHDLGEEWKQMTGLPFVFATWMVRDGVAVGDLGTRLRNCLSNGLSRVDGLVERHGIPRGWPADVARKYLTEYLKFEIGDQQLLAIERFHALAAECGIIPAPARPLQFA